MSFKQQDKKIVFGGFLLVFFALATKDSIAQNCEVNLTRSSDGILTRIRTGDAFSIIEFAGSNSSSWRTYVKNGNNLMTIDENGLTDSEGINNLDQLLNSPLDGTSFATSDGRLTIDSTNGNKWSLGSSESAKHSLTGPNNELAALYCNSPNFTNVFVQNNSIVTLVDRKCQVMTLPISRLDDSTKSVIANLTQEASSGESKGKLAPPKKPHHGPHPHPPPPNHGPLTKPKLEPQDQNNSNSSASGDHSNKQQQQGYSS